MRRLLCCVLLLLAGSAAQAEDYRVETVAEGLDHPWSLAFLPDGRMLVTERVGRLRVIGTDGSLSAPVEGVPAVHAESQGGLFDVLPARDFADSGQIYLSYADGPAGANATALMRARLEGGELIASEPLFRAKPAKDTPVHYGGRMCWMADGTLLLGMGDGFDFREQAQDPDNHLGTIVRLTADGGVPEDNPFADGGGRPEVYSYGHRNVQGLLCDADGVLAHEHGPQGGDELNRIEAGANYGWPVVTGGLDYNNARVTPFDSRPGMLPPLLEWTPSIGPSGLTRYSGDAFPEWQGDLFVATLVEPGVRRVRLRGDEILGQEVLFEAQGQRIRDVRAGPDGALYLLTDAEDGAVLRVLPAR
jgi:glucose/arabinose dehydrogenase